MAVKRQVLELLEQGQLEQIADLAVQKKRVLGSLISMTYRPDPLIAWRAIEAMGMAAARIAETDSDYVLEHLRRLYWLILEESGGICWRAPECMAEVAGRMHDDDKLEAYVPIAFHMINELPDEDLQHFRNGCLWAIGRLHAITDEELDEVLPAVVWALDMSISQSRGMAVWCLQQVGRADLFSDRQELFSDDGAVTLYEDRQLVQTTVGELASRSLNP